VITNNKIILNQTFNQSADPSGGGLFIGGQVVAAGETPAGTGNVNADRNLIQYNHAGAGAGGGVSIARTVNNHAVVLTNNMIVNNVAAYTGGGVAVADATTNVRFVNNTVANNASTATNRQSFPSGPKVQSLPQIAGIARLSGSGPTLLNNIVWGNESFTWSINKTVVPETTALAPAGIRDTGSLGSNAPLTSSNSVLTAGSSTSNCTSCLSADALAVAFVRPIKMLSQTDTDQPVVLPETTIMQTALTFDEGGNFINVNFSPLTPFDLGDSTKLRSDYHIQDVSVAINAGADRSGSNRVPTTDFDGDSRPGVGVDIGADEIVPKADLSITLTDGVGSVRPGATLNYTLVVSNSGPASVTGAVVSDSMPSTISSWTWTCTGTGCGTGTTGSGSINKTLGTLPSGASVSFAIAATVRGSATTSVVNSATVAAPAGVTDTDAANNSATDTDTLILPTADLAITVSNGVNAVVRRGAVSYSIVVTNLGPDTVTGATVTANEPNGLSWSWSCAGAACGGSGNSGSGDINKTLGALAMNAAVTFTAVETDVNPGNSQNTLSLSASVLAPGAVQEINAANNTAADTDPIVPPSVVFTSESGSAGFTNSNTTLDFGSQNGTPTDTVTLTVGGTAAVTFQTAAVTGNAEFTKGTDTCSGQLKNPGSTCTIQIIFNAAGSTTRNATLSVPFSGGAGSPLSLALTGR
jgi:uncharacterized repeat protein (TIGR01451 family)